MSTTLCSLGSSVWPVPGILGGQGKYYSRAGGGRALDNEIYKDFEVVINSFVFWTIWRRNASQVASQRGIVSAHDCLD